MTDQEYLRQAKKRALEYLDKGDNIAAVGSMLSDLGRHPVLKRNHRILAAPFHTFEFPEAVRNWINGFK